jgi:dynein heavy chain
LSAQNSVASNEHAGLPDLIKFWNKRSHHLNGIYEQLTRPGILKIIEVLKKSKSSYLDQFTRLSNLIQEGSTEAADNIKYLSILSDTCIELAKSDVQQILGILPKFFHRFRFIRTHSRFYSSDERMTSLFRQLSHEVVQRCIAKVSLQDIFFGDPYACIRLLNDCIQCCEGWKKFYDSGISHVERETHQRWDYDKGSIFAQVDAFIQRCRDLVDICEGQIQFSRKHSDGKKRPLPVFGGLRGLEVTKGLEDLETLFLRHVTSLWEIRSIILDVKAVQWHDSCGQFKKAIRDLEMRFQNLINQAFSETTAFDRQVELCDTFYNIVFRESLKRHLEKKIKEVQNALLGHINSSKLEFERRKQTPDIVRFHPDFAGSAFWAKMFLKRIRHYFNRIQDAAFSSVHPLDPKIAEQYELLCNSLEEYINKTYMEWVHGLQAVTSNQNGFKLSQPVLTRKSDNTLLVTFDRDLLRNFYESLYWQKMKHDIPPQIHDLMTRKDELRYHRQGVLSVAREYNTILQSLLPEELTLFKERFRFMDKKLQPGLSKVNWGSARLIENFVNDARNGITEVSRVIANFADSSATILKDCVEIAQITLCHVEHKRIYQLEEFETYQQGYRQMMRTKLQIIHDRIKKEMKTIYATFETDGPDVLMFWLKIVEKVDQLVQEALRLSVKKSLQELSRAINGDGGSKDSLIEMHPIFNLFVVLESQKVEFNPSLNVLEDHVNKIARDMISTISVVPRISDMFSTSKQSSSFYEEIIRENEVLRIFVNIQHVMSDNTVKCQNYVRTWDTYREIWEINKDAFIRRYAKLQPTIATFDSDINRYHEVANNALKEETYTTVKFVRLDCSP